MLLNGKKSNDTLNAKIDPSIKVKDCFYVSYLFEFFLNLFLKIMIAFICCHLTILINIHNQTNSNQEQEQILLISFLYNRIAICILLHTPNNIAIVGDIIDNTLTLCANYKILYTVFYTFLYLIFL